MSTIAALASHLHGQHAAACRRRRTAAPWTHTGTHYLSSDGAAGSYADAVTSAAARVFLDGAGPDAATVAMWARPTSGGYIYDITDDGNPGLRGPTADGDEWAPEWRDDAGSNVGATRYSLAGGSWHHIAVSITPTGATFFLDGLDGGAGEQSTTGYTFATAANAFTLFADFAHANRLAGDIRSPAIWARALSSDELLSLASDTTPAHDLRLQATDYLGSGQAGPVHWWPADGDSGTTVTDRGSVGTCNLALHGGVTIEVA